MRKNALKQERNWAKGITSKFFEIQSEFFLFFLEKVKSPNPLLSLTSVTFF